MIRIATPEDYKSALEMAIKFADSSPYKDLCDPEVIGSIVKVFIESDPSEKIILLYEDKGFLVAAITQFHFGTTKVATEVAWWVDPEYRAQGIGDQLIEAFEFWADKLGCKVKTLAFMDKDLSKYMKKKGYEPYETAHYKMN